MEDEQKKGQYEEIEEDDEYVEEREVNKEVESHVEALNEVEIKDMHKKLEEETLAETRDDTQLTPLIAPKLAQQAKLIDVVVKDTVEKALKYT